MAESIQQRLLRRARPYQTSKLGPSIDDIFNLEVTQEFVDDLRLALQSGYFDATKCALFFCQGLLQQATTPKLFELLQSEIPNLLRSGVRYLRGYVVPVMVAARQHLPNFRGTIIS